MRDLPILQPRGQRPAVKPSRFDIPILGKRGFVPGRGPKVEYQFQTERSGTFAEEQRHAADLEIVRWVGEVLHTHYRGQFWSVLVDSHQGLCRIGIPVLLGNWTFNIPLPLLTPAMVIRAGGEILERFKIPRGSLDVAAFCEARKLRVSRANQRPPT